MTRFFLALFLFSTPTFALDLRLREIARLSAPVAITHAGDQRLFITLQDGLVMIHDGERVLPTPFLDVTDLTNGIGERGLLSIAFHPNYSANGLFFIYYTNLEGDIVIARYSRSASDANRADRTSARIILTIPHRQERNHNGGQLQFGPDGFLYIGTGDGGGRGDPFENGQDVGELLGKLLRIDIDREEGSRAYGIPASNPFTGSLTARPEIWAYGLRNPWRFSFDRVTGDLYIADVGQDRFEEVNFQPAASSGGENYGWDVMEASACFEPQTNCSREGLVLPVAEYGRGLGCSITGGYVYRGRKYPRLRGTYFYGDLCTGNIWALTRTAGGNWIDDIVLDTNLTISTFGEDVDGELYVADHNGRVMAIEDLVGVQPRRRAVRR